MLKPELLDLIQSRMVSAYNEQLWAVALVISMCYYLITKADQLLESLSYKKIIIGIWVVTSMCVLFILLRHGVYFRYSRLIDQEFPILNDLSGTMAYARWVVMLSGVALYSSIAVGLTALAHIVCKKAEKRRKEKGIPATRT